MSGIFDTSVVNDFDTPFVVDAETREITNKSLTKRILMQNDHNSERFSFEIPRFVEGRDVALCNVAQVVYVNIDARTKRQSNGVYMIEDLNIYPFVNDILTGTWLISQNATRYEGNLSFMLRFATVDDDGKVKYAWSTKVFEDISVVKSLESAETFTTDYVDVIQQWKNYVMDELYVFTDLTVKNHVNVAQIDVNKTDISELKTEQAIQKARMDGFTALKEGSTTGDAELADIRVDVDGITYPSAGEAVRAQSNKIRLCTETSKSIRPFTLIGNFINSKTPSYSGVWDEYLTNKLIPNRKYLMVINDNIDCIKTLGLLNKSGGWEKTYPTNRIDGSRYAILETSTNSKALCVVFSGDSVGKTIAYTLEIYDVTDENDINTEMVNMAKGYSFNDVANLFNKVNNGVDKSKKMISLSAMYIKTYAIIPSYNGSYVKFLENSLDENKKYLLVVDDLYVDRVGAINLSGAWEKNVDTTKYDDNISYGIITTSSNSRSLAVIFNNLAVGKNISGTVYIYDVTNETETIDGTFIRGLLGISAHDITKDIAKKMTNRWAGKKVLFMGDSLTAAKQYQNTISEKLNIEVYNHCLGGAGIIQIVDGNNAGTISAITPEEVKDKDLIVFYAGYNNRGAADGIVGDCYAVDGSGQNTIAGYMQYAINRIYECLINSGNTTCKILIVTVDCAGKYQYIDADGYAEYPTGSGQTMETMANIQKAVAEYNSIPCCDLWHTSGINRHTWSVFGANPQSYIPNPTNTNVPYPHNGDQLHKSSAGYARIGEVITAAIINAYGI